MYHTIRSEAITVTQIQNVAIQNSKFLLESASKPEELYIRQSAWIQIKTKYFACKTYTSPQTNFQRMQYSNRKSNYP